MAVNNYNYLSYGGDMMLFIGASPMAFSTSAKLNVSMKTREITSKDSVGDWLEKIKGKFDWNCSSDSLMNFSSTGTTLSLDELFVSFTGGTPVQIVFGSKTGTSPSWTNNTAKKYFSGEALIVSLDMTANDNDNATYTISLEGNGALTLT